MSTGNPRGRTCASRGIRQGDTLSLFIFLLVVDILRRMILKGVEGNIVKLSSWKGQGSPLISSSLLIVFFCYGKKDSFLKLNYIRAFCDYLEP